MFILWCLPGRPGHSDNHCVAIQRAILRIFFFFPQSARSKFLLELYTREESHLADRIQSDSCSAGHSWWGGGGGVCLSPTCFLSSVLCFTLWTHLQNHLFLRTPACPALSLLACFFCLKGTSALVFSKEPPGYERKTLKSHLAQGSFVLKGLKVRVLNFISRESQTWTWY